MADRFFARKLPYIVEWPEFDGLCVERKSELLLWASRSLCKDVAKLYNIWLGIIKEYEVYQFQDLKSLSPTVRSTANSVIVTKVMRQFRQLNAEIKHFSSLEDYEFARQLASEAGLELPGHVPSGPAVDWTQEALQLLIRMPEPKPAKPRKRGRPENPQIKAIASRLIDSWRSLVPRLPDRSADDNGIFSFFDLVSEGLIFQYEICWTAHELSARWPPGGEPVLYSPFKLSDSLLLLRGALDTLIRKHSSLHT